MPCEDMFMSNDPQEISESILHKGAYGWGLEMLCCEQETNINPQSGLLPPLGNKIPVQSLFTGTVWKAVLSYCLCMINTVLSYMKRVSKLNSVLTCLWSSITTKKAIQYRGLNARLFITQYAYVIQSHPCSHYTVSEYLQHCKVKEASWHFHASKN